MNKKLIPYLQLHTAVLLYGLTAILGDLISISALSLVWWRVLITSVSLLFFVGFGKKIWSMDRRLILKYMGIGVIVGLHWLCFYGSIKFANASIALATMATVTLFTSVIEPILTDKKFQWLELGLGVLIIPPMLMIAQNISLDMKTGLWVGLLSAFLAATFSTLNKKYVTQASSYQITFLEMSSAWLFISLLLPFIISAEVPLMPLPSDWKYLIMLSLACTTFAFIISLKALEHVSAFEANLVINLEPVYGIILAAIILKEHTELPPNFYWAITFIMLIVLSHPLIKKYVGKKNTVSK